MKFHMKDFRDDQSILLEEEIEAGKLDIDIGVMRFSDAILVKAQAWKIEQDLTIEAHIEADRQFTCSLCLEEFHNVFEKDITLHYDIKGLDSVTIDTDIRDELLLEHPIRVLCRPDCRGLCATCGANLNEGACKCKINHKV